jgi:transcriptional regulator with GAF, ATPase, and Fis domain
MKQLVEEGEKLLAQLKYRELATLHKIIEIVNLTSDLNKLLNKIMDIAIEVVGAERGILFLYQNGEYEAKIVKGVEEEIVKTISSISKTTIKEVTEKKKPIISMHTLEEKSYQLKRSIQLYQIKSIFCFPLLIDSQVIGVLYLDTRKIPLFIQDKDLLFLQSFVHLLSISLKNAKAYQLLEQENIYLHQTSSSSFSSTLVGKSLPMKQLYNLLTTISKTDAPVLIEGETGVGKELVAREIHKLSNRRDKNFITIDCPTIPKELFEAELFGYKRGAFTGAIQDKKGLIEEGDKGTVFFDEIGELPLPLQAKLLRILQEKQIRRVGETFFKKIDVRIICATNKNLEEEIKKLTFREDLYYRLNVVKIFVPPLRERKEDIPLLIHHFLQLYSKKFNIPIKGITPQAIEFLLSYSWPGNIRELENKIAQSILLTPPNSYITPSSLSIPTTSQSSLSLLQETEKSLILQTLRLYNFNKTKTAKALGISRVGLFKKLKKYKIVNNVNTESKNYKNKKNK